MSEASATATKFAKNATARSFGERRKGLQLNSAVMRISRDLYPVKTSQHLSDLTGYSVRACEYWLSEKVVIPSDALASLMKSSKGRDYLVAVMADNTPRWWLQLKAWLASIDYAAAEIKQRRKLRELLDDEARRQRPIAVSFQDEADNQGRHLPARAPAGIRKR